MTKQDKLKFRDGTVEHKKEVLNNQLESQLKILKQSPDIHVIRFAQGQVDLLETLISALG